MSSNQSQAKPSTKNAVVLRNRTPMIVERVNKIPIVSFAVSMGFSQYDKIKSSHATVNQVFTKAEGLAAYLWQKVQPIVEKLEEPINKADRLACNTLDFVENKLQSMDFRATAKTD